MLDKTHETRMNHERYNDPTADYAIGRVMREEKLKKKRKERERWRREVEEGSTRKCHGGSSSVK